MLSAGLWVSSAWPRVQAIPGPFPASSGRHAGWAALELAACAVFAIKKIYFFLNEVSNATSEPIPKGGDQRWVLLGQAPKLLVPGAQFSLG